MVVIGRGKVLHSIQGIKVLGMKVISAEIVVNDKRKIFRRMRL